MSSSDNQALLDRIDQLEKTVSTHGHFINHLETAHKKTKDELRALQEKTKKKEELKEMSVFSVRLTRTQDLSTSNWSPLDKNLKTYKASPHFDASNLRYTAPVNGHYQFDMGMRQGSSNGGIEIMLNIGADGDTNHAYIGKTNGPHTTVHKTMVLTLKQGDTVWGVVRKTSGSPNILWCAFHGFLITASNDNYNYVSCVEEKEPSAPPSHG